MGRWLRAYGLLTGGIIGVGVFGLPAALVQSGLLLFLVQLAVVTVLVWWIHASYLAVVVATPGRHRLPGYARIHLGKRWYALTAVTETFGFVGALVAYLIAGGQFLALLAEPLGVLPPLAASVVYLIPGAILLSFGIRALPAIELVILALFLVVLLALPAVAGRDLALTRIPLLGEPSAVILPYGILLFSLWGTSLIPDTAELAGRSPRRSRRVLTAGLATAVLAYVFFSVLVPALTGQETTEDALTGLKSVLGDGVVLLALLFGILTTLSSYLALGLVLLRTLTLDLRLPRAAAWVVTVFVPVILMLLGVKSLLAVLSLTGAVFLGIEGLVVLALRRAIAKKGHAGPRRWTAAAAALLLLTGIVGTLAYQVLY